MVATYLDSFASPAVGRPCLQGCRHLSGSQLDSACDHNRQPYTQHWPGCARAPQVSFVFPNLYILQQYSCELPSATMGYQCPRIPMVQIYVNVACSRCMHPCFQLFHLCHPSISSCSELADSTRYQAVCEPELVGACRLHVRSRRGQGLMQNVPRSANRRHDQDPMDPRGAYIAHNPDSRPKGQRYGLQVFPNMLIHTETLVQADSTIPCNACTLEHRLPKFSILTATACSVLPARVIDANTYNLEPIPMMQNLEQALCTLRKCQVPHPSHFSPAEVLCSRRAKLRCVLVHRTCWW